MHRSQVITTFLLAFCLTPVVAQSVSKNIKDQSLLWVRYVQKISINQKWSLYGEIETRRYVFPGRQHQWLIPRFVLFYRTKNNIDLGIAGAFFLHALPQDDNPVKFIRPEIRPHQEINLQQNLGRCKIIHRYIVEERFFHKMEQDELVPGWDFSLRFRYRIQLQILLISEEKKIPVQLRLFDEIFININKEIVYNVFDHNRLFSGLSFHFSDQWSGDIGYMNWFQQRPSGQDFYNRHILRITLTHSL